MKEPFKSLAMSTKRVFDDMYLFLKEANKTSAHLDDNGMPAHSYEELTSQFWNLIYKDQEAGGEGSINVQSSEAEF